MKFLILSAVLLTALIVGPSFACADITGILVPAYSNPAFSTDGSAMWNSLVSTAQDPNRNFAIRAIVNPSSGPGASGNQAGYLDDYFGTGGTGPAAQFRSAGGQTFGYVWTDRGNRAASVVQSEIDAYLGGTYAGNFDGVFFDDFYDEASDIAYYNLLDSYISNNYANALVIGNVGDVGGLNQLSSAQAQSLISPLDVLVSHEMPPTNPNPNFSGYVSNFTPLTHAGDFSDSKFAHLVHDAGSSWDESLLDLALTRDAGWLYATPDSGDNPWDNFDPIFWNSFTQSVNAIPEPSSALSFSVFAVLLATRRQRSLVR